MRVRFLFLALVFTLIWNSSACLVAYRDVVFKPNVSVVSPPHEINYTQDVLRDYAVLNFTNDHDFPIFDIDITFKDVEVSKTILKPNETLNGSYDLTKENFKIRVKADVLGKRDDFRVRYTIYNDYDHNLNVSVEM